MYRSLTVNGVLHAAGRRKGLARNQLSVERGQGVDIAAVHRSPGDTVPTGGLSAAGYPAQAGLPQSACRMQRVAPIGLGSEHRLYLGGPALATSGRRPGVASRRIGRREPNWSALKAAASRLPGPRGIQGEGLPPLFISCHLRGMTFALQLHDNPHTECGRPRTS